MLNSDALKVASEYDDEILLNIVDFPKKLV